jgi:uncharacterized protein (DUF1800 family)
MQQNMATCDDSRDCDESTSRGYTSVKKSSHIRRNFLHFLAELAIPQLAIPRFSAGQEMWNSRSIEPNRFTRTCLLGLVIISVFLPNFLNAENIDLTPGNLSHFTLLRTKAPFITCYSTEKQGRLGTLLQGTVAIGNRWTLLTKSDTTKNLKQVNRKLTNLLRKRRAKRKQIADLKKQQAWWKAADKGLSTFSHSCKKKSPLPAPPDVPLPWEEPQIPAEGEFKGSATSLSPYREKLSAHEVQHLLDKVAFGGSSELFEIGVTKGLTPLVYALIEGISSSSERDALISNAHIWSERAFYRNEEDSELKGVKIWTTEVIQIRQFYRSIFTKDPFHEWMVLQLSAHFAVNLNQIGFSYSDYNGPALEQHWNTLQSEARGNIRRLSKTLLSDPAMNFWLNNKDNRVGEPNQNFARELLELFLLGAIDPLSHQPNYDEESVVAATAYLSGYEEFTRRNPLDGRDMVGIRFSPALHDNSAYTIFRGIARAERQQTLSPEGVIDHILDNHVGAPRYIAERFAGNLLFPGLSERMVQELAELLIKSDYDLKPYLKKVLSSEAMFSEESRSACITSPLESFLKTARRVPPPLDSTGDLAETSYWALYNSISATREAGQTFFEPPSVFGWKGSCNINRSGAISRGEGWLTAQRQLNLQQACITYFNHLNELKIDYRTIFSLTASDTAESIASKIYYSFFWKPVPEAARVAFAQYLLTERNDEGIDTSTQVNLSSEYYMRRKIPHLVCAMGTLMDSNRR